MFDIAHITIPCALDDKDRKGRGTERFALLGGDGTALRCGSVLLRTATGSAASAPPAPHRGAIGPAHHGRSRSVAILGAGNGGMALAGVLAHQGHRVALWNRSAERVAPIASLGGIRVTLPGSAATVARVAVATSNLAVALANVRLVLVAVPASAHADVARACAPLLREGQTILLMPGRTGGALEFRRVLHEARCRVRILLGETNTFPVAARGVGPATAVVYGTKDEVRAAALPATRTPELLAAWRPALPMLAPARSVLHTGLANVGAILHPVITLFNAERIARGDVFDFYTEGTTPRVAAVLEAADAERLRVARAYGVGTCSLPEWIAAAYGHRADTMLHAVGSNPAYVGIKAPVSLDHRYLWEDVPTGLIPLIELGAVAGLATPTLRGLVAEARHALGGERWQSPRTLDALGLDGLDPVAIRAVVEGGIRIRRFASLRKVRRETGADSLNLSERAIA